DFGALDGDVGEALAVWRSECDASRAVVAAAESLDQTGVRKRDCQPFSLRWLLVDVIAEYARHAGHADLLRERIDGRTGH
ncbi:MAG: DinB family protein, partial [Actinomycetota bacterium]|nr:DinB family protein [Actinomycetota bacterium]